MFLQCGMKILLLKKVALTLFETTCAIADWEPASDIKNCIKTKKKTASLSVCCLQSSLVKVSYPSSMTN